MRKSFWTAKRVWIVGASSGIGRALSQSLAGKGATVIASARNSNALDALKLEQSTLGFDARPIPVDVIDGNSVHQAYSEIIRSIGRVDALIYCAGDWAPVDVPVINLEQVELQTQVNHLGLVRCVAEVLPDMVKQASGIIAGVTSASAFAPLPRAEAYGASKAAANYFLRSLRADVQRLGITVVAVTPGFVDTQLTRKNDFKMPFLISAEAAANAIIRGIENGNNEISPPFQLTIPLRLLGLLPRQIQERIVSAIFRRN